MNAFTQSIHQVLSPYCLREGIIVLYISFISAVYNDVIEMPLLRRNLDNPLTSAKPCATRSVIRPAASKPKNGTSGTDEQNRALKNTPHPNTMRPPSFVLK